MYVWDGRAAPVRPARRGPGEGATGTTGATDPEGATARDAAEGRALQAASRALRTAAGRLLTDAERLRADAAALRALSRAALARLPRRRAHAARSPARPLEASGPRPARPAGPREHP